ncbi:uroporphyrinogen-III synthase [Rhizobium sp. TRM95111]|uniref:uroporphyrinogen-III synthase n=1 Tax=Rhizobium alarense TaxID=2846851 RepID=UPI001F22761D|nr:uroporphyrinogen-III synthase [Rhizobium alarense]MCF3640015.1 uroporphyrinogen-III synthase [Rhizobium alarense]
MRVLVLRPHESAERSARRLAELGHEPVLLPLFEPLHDSAAIRAALAERYSAIAVTSAEAVRALSSLGTALDRHLLATVFAVGKATAKAATDAGFRTVLTPEGNGRDLADLIIQRSEAYGRPNDPILYIAGDPRATGFETRLEQAGLPLRLVEGYRMEATKPRRSEIEPLLVSRPPDAVLLYSRESAAEFFALPAVADNLDRFARTLFLCLSANVAAAVPEAFARSVVVSTRPDEASLLDLL